MSICRDPTGARPRGHEWALRGTGNAGGRLSDQHVISVGAAMEDPNPFNHPDPENDPVPEDDPARQAPIEEPPKKQPQ